MLYPNITYEDEYYSDDYDTLTVYYRAPSGMLNGKYPEAEGCTISVELPASDDPLRDAFVMVSPTKDGSDYDWSDIDMSYDDIFALVTMRYAKETRDK